MLGIIAAYLLPSMRQQIDTAYRDLPHVSQGARLLDVGFGDATFLENAQSAGWEVAGVDMDSVVVNLAQQRGLNVRQGSIEVFADQPGSFDVITISHVIEHVYNPVEFLKVAFGLLKPGGRLWLDTPNMESFGYARFGKDWRGLEPPRHLVLFNSKSIGYALKQSGFDTWKLIDRAPVTRGVFTASEKIRGSLSPVGEALSEIGLSARVLEIAAKFIRKRAEFITLIAEKSA